jgi:hypothetical protein
MAGAEHAGAGMGLTGGDGDAGNGLIDDGRRDAALGDDEYLAHRAVFPSE